MLHEAVAAYGLHIFGRSSIDERADTPWRSVWLVGPAPGLFWRNFSNSKEARDGAPDPIDRWSRRVAQKIAQDYGLEAVFPFGDPPDQPFLHWALRSGTFFSSPIGLLVHPHFGLWASFRFGLLSVEYAVTSLHSSPCTGFAEPCRTRCPVDAFADGFDAQKCARHVRSEAGLACRKQGCLARHACPAGVAMAPEPERAAHHMAIFVKNRMACAE